MLRLVISTLAVTAALSTVSHAQTAEPLKATADGLAVEVDDLRWAPLDEWEKGRRVFGERYGLGFNYRLQQNAKALKSADTEFWVEDASGVKQSLSGSQRSQGESVKGYWAGLNPQRSYSLVWEVLDEKAPDIADGRTTETFDFEAPLPAAGQSRALDLKRITERGATVQLREIKRTDEGLELMFEWQPPAKSEDLMVNLRIEAGEALDDKGTKLGGKRGSSLVYPYHREKNVVKQALKLNGAPAADARTVQFTLTALQIAQSQRLPQWFHRVSVPFQGANLPVSATADKSAPLATVKTGDSTATLESVEERNGTINARLWFEGAQPRGQWRVATANVKSEDGGEPFIHRSNQLGNDYFFSRDGEMAPGKSGVQLSFSRPQGATFELAGEAEQYQSASKTFDFANIPFPAKAGEMVAPKIVRENADSSKLILWKVGRFDTLHQPILGPYSPNPKKPIDWEGLVLVWEYRPADKDKNVKTKFDDIDFRDDKGGVFRGGVAAKNDGMKFGSHDGDVWRTTKEKDASGLTFKETGKTWYSMFKPLPSAGATSLAATMKIEESAIIATMPFRFETVAMPDAAADSR